jgi:nucleoside-diphosphate-sugar epimerase
MNKLLIIGGCGYIGTKLCEVLKNSYNITIIDLVVYNNRVFDNIEIINDDVNNIETDFYNSFNIIIYLAGNSSVKSSSNLYSTIENNINNIMKIIRNTSYDQKIIYASSSSVYGNIQDNIVNECYNNTIPHNYYDITKKILDDFVELIIKQEKRQIFGLRFGTVNGFSYNFRNDIMINAIVCNAFKSGNIIIYSKETKRPILGINDLCNAISIIIQKGNIANSGIYNLASFNSTTELIGLKISSIMKLPIIINNNTENIITNEKLQTSSYNFHIDCNKFIKNFDFIFEDTIETITNNIIDNYSKIIKIGGRHDDFYINQINKSTIINTCRICDNNNLFCVLDLKEQPLANDFKKNKIVKEHAYPLKLMLCEECYHLQLSIVVNPNILYKNYMYLSGTSETLTNYFTELADYIINKTVKIGTIVEIACNDGTQLNIFKQKGWSTIGVDPAENLSIMSNINNDIYCDFWNDKVANAILSKYTNIDVILAQNVLAHTHDVNEFIKSCKIIMSDQTKLFIQVSQANMVRDNQFDTVYHEHLSFFNINSMNYLIRKHDLYINKITKPNIHGVSYLFEISKFNDNNSNLIELLEEEKNIGLNDGNKYNIYSNICKKRAMEFKMAIYEYIKKGYTIVGYGASAKGNTLLNYLKLSDEIEFIVDDNNNKHNLLTPGSNILVCDKKSLINYEKLAILMITWNFKDEIIKKIQGVRGDKITEYIYY